MIAPTYESLIENGCSPRMAEMLACQKAPGGKTDDIVHSAGDISQQFKNDQRALNGYMESAKKQGFTPGKNDTYIPELARFPGDKEAWVPHTEGRGYIKKKFEERGWQCEGLVNTEYRPSPPEEKPLAEDIIRDTMNDYRKHPRLKKMKPEALREVVLDKHSPQWGTEDGNKYLEDKNINTLIESVDG